MHLSFRYLHIFIFNCLLHYSSNKEVKNTSSIYVAFSHLMAGLKEKHSNCVSVFFIQNTIVKSIFSVPQSFTLVCIVGTIGLCFNFYTTITKKIQHISKLVESKNNSKKILYSPQVMI